MQKQREHELAVLTLQRDTAASNAAAATATAATVTTQPQPATPDDEQFNEDAERIKLNTAIGQGLDFLKL